MARQGAVYNKQKGTTFTVFAPEKERIVVNVISPVNFQIELKKGPEGFFTGISEQVKAGARYFLRPDDEDNFPDPASRFQPEGVHGPSEVIDQEKFSWTDESWKGIALGDFILYELHVGTFTKEGTFDAVIKRLDDLLATGINAIEILPVAQFPGHHNWGYDGVYPYAVQNSYGGPDGLKRLVDACHNKGIAVILDVVYNHLGPEGNYFPKFGPFFTDHYKVPWGDAINFDGAWSDGVRGYFSENALYWLEHFHIDGLRLDAIHGIFDAGTTHILQLINEKVDELESRMGRQFHIIAESDLNDPKVIRPVDSGGYGFSAQWLDDFHHSLYVFLHENGKKYYEDFGKIEQLAKAYTDGFVHSGEFVKFRKKKYGASSVGIPGNKFVAFIENHDQCGNRVRGQRLTTLINHDRKKLAAAALMLSPYIPMLFMGEEYGEDVPFFYFVDHSDKNLIKAVREGRKKEFAAMQWSEEPADPEARETFEASVLQWEKRNEGKYREMLGWYRSLIALRRTSPALHSYNKNNIRVNTLGEKLLSLHRVCDEGINHVFAVFNFSESEIDYPMIDHGSEWIRRLDSHNEAECKIMSGEMMKIRPLQVVVFEAL